MKKLMLMLTMILSFSAIKAQHVITLSNGSRIAVIRGTTPMVKAKKANTIRTSDGNYIAIPKETPTGQSFKGEDGEIYPVYQSSTGKLFVKKISPKTGKEYRFYLTLN